MPRHQFDGLARADQQHLFFVQVLKYFFRQTHSGIGHRHGAGADCGVGAHLLGDREGLLKKPVQDFAGGAGLVRRREGAFHLSENLRLAQHHGIEAGRHAERVPHRVPVGVQIQVRFNVVRRQTVKLAEPLERLAAVVVIEAAIHLGAVAGGENRGFVHAGLFGNFAQRLRQLLGRERRLFADGNRRGLVVNAEGDEVHATREIARLNWKA